VPRGLMKRTLWYRPVNPAHIEKWSGVLALFDGAVPFVVAPCDREQAGRALDGLRIDADDRWSDMPPAEVYELARRRPAAVAIAAPRTATSRFSVTRPLSLTFWGMVTWLRRRHDRRELRNATNLLCVAPDQILEDIGVSRDEMLAKCMCPRHAGKAVDETEPDR
jgi:uncharacterized protein YjiS (DUF1127 family)